MMPPTARSALAAMFLLAHGLVVLPAPAQEDDENGAGTTPATGMSALAGIVPLGKTHEEIIYPTFAGGKLNSVMTAKTATRNNDEFLDLTDMTIELYENGVSSFNIILQTAAYFLETKTLASDQHTVIKGKAFTISGDSMVFDTESGQGQLEGNIKMVIDDIQAFTPDPDPLEPDQPAPEPDGDGSSAPTGAAAPDETPPAPGEAHDAPPTVE
ncbi:hypothetical protein BH23VER1_BH23VER1_18220 [soil metagenome]